MLSGYQNNLTDGAADPMILTANGKYYLYSTGGSAFYVKISSNLRSWVKQSTPILKLSDTAWAKQNGWAPEAYFYNGRYYLVFSAMNANGIHCIDIAVSDSPNGQFRPLADTPFYAPGYSVIDASLFFDDDGRIYLYYSKDCSTNTVDGRRTSQTWGIEVKSDFSGTIGKAVLISTPDQSWEMISGDPLWNEGPVVFKENGTYYLLYSANYYRSQNYSVGYATAKSPLTFFTKPKNNRILQGNGKTVTGPGHCNIFRSPDGSELYIVYHVHTVPPTIDKGRSAAIDRLLVNGDGTLSVAGPSLLLMPVPSGVNGFIRVHDGFSVTVDGESAPNPSYSDVENIFDGLLASNSKDLLYFKDGGTLTLTFADKLPLSSLWVYPAQMLSYRPASMTVEINGTYIIENISLDNADGAAGIASFARLPSDTLVETVKITFHTASGREYAAINELVLIKK